MNGLVDSIQRLAVSNTDEPCHGGGGDTSKRDATRKKLQLEVHWLFYKQTNKQT